MLLPFSRVVEGNITDHLCHPCTEVGPRLKLIQLPQRQQRCFLHDIFSAAAVAGDANCHEPEGAKGCFELRSEIQRLLVTARSTLARRIPVCPAHVNTTEKGMSRPCQNLAIHVES